MAAQDFAHELEASIENGMLIAYHAESQGDLSAVVTPYGERTFAQLNGNANKLVRLLEQHGIGPGDSVRRSHQEPSGIH